MSKILIIGNVIKDVYLKLDERQNNFETDANDVSWLNLGFDGEAHAFFHRTSVYGGAAVSLAVLNRLGVDARILNSKTEFQNGELVWQDDVTDYRYILCHEGNITYFVPSTRRVTDWRMPDGTPEWILVDRSAVISTRLVDELKNFIKFSPNTKLAVHAEKRPTPAGRKLQELANLLIIEDADWESQEHPAEQMVCYITPQKIIVNGAEETYTLKRTDMMTHLTVYSTIAATILGVISAGGSAALAAMWARLNAEQATLESSLSGRRLQELTRQEMEKRANLKLIARSLMAKGKGVLALDAADRVLGERLAAAGIRVNKDTPRTLRELMLTTPELKEYISGVILEPNAAELKILRNQTYLEYLTNRGIITGVKADKGASNGVEPYPLGIEDLPVRLRNYYELGIRFAKWHLKYQLGKNLPSYIAVQENVRLAAEFAKECQLAGLVPMIESDVLGAGHSARDCLEAANSTLTALTEALTERKVSLESCIIKTNMVQGGTTPHEIGMATAVILRHCLPEKLAGVLLLSGGQGAKQALDNLHAVLGEGDFAWPVSFAFGRALEEPVLKVWHGQEANAKIAQADLRRYLQELTKK